MYTAYTHIQLYAFNLIVFATAMWNGQPVKIIVVIRWVKINVQSELEIIPEDISSNIKATH